MLSGPVRTRDRTAKKHGYDYRIDRCSLISHYIHRSTVPRFGHQSGYSSPKCVPFMLSLPLSLSCSHFSLTHTQAHTHTLSQALTLCRSLPTFSLSLGLWITHTTGLSRKTLGCHKFFCELSNTRKNDTSKLRISSKARLYSLYLRIACLDDSVCSV